VVDGLQEDGQQEDGQQERQEDGQQEDGQQEDGQQERQEDGQKEKQPTVQPKVQQQTYDRSYTYYLSAIIFVCWSFWMAGWLERVRPAPNKNRSIL
jgi:hypothetical protein